MSWYRMDIILYKNPGMLFIMFKNKDLRTDVNACITTRLHGECLVSGACVTPELLYFFMLFIFVFF
jgi:hypothetical protein